MTMVLFSSPLAETPLLESSFASGQRYEFLGIVSPGGLSGVSKALGTDVRVRERRPREQGWRFSSPGLALVCPIRSTFSAAVQY